MKVWRITRVQYLSELLSGRGAALCGGRWNSIGVNMVYASTTRPLVALEMLVHLEPDTVPSDYLMCEIDIPDTFIEGLSTTPRRGDGEMTEADSRRIGDRWIESNSSVGLLVPSAVITREFNVLINPAHPEFRTVKAVDSEANFLSRRFFPEP